MEGFDYNKFLDFDETSNFLSAILKTVPSLEEIPEWNELNLALGDAPSANLYSSNLEVSTEDTKNQINYFPDDQFSSARLASYTELIDSHFIASLEQSPNTTFSSPHALPTDIIGKDPSAFQYANTDYQFSVSNNEMNPNHFVKQESPKELVKQDTSDSVPYDDSVDSDSSMKKNSPVNHVKRSHDDDNSEDLGKTEKKFRTSHRVIERNYRCNINSKINQLRDVVPTLKIVTGKTNLLIADLEGLVPASKLNKASVLSKAIEYIDHLQRKNDSLQAKIAKLQELVGNASAQSGIQNAAVKMEPSVSMSSRFDFAFDFNDNNMGLIYSSDVVPPENATQAYPLNYSPSRNSNLMLGGLAVSMGSSFITDDNFRGLSALPVAGIFSRSPVLASQLITTLRFVVLGMGILMMVEHIRLEFFNKSKKKVASQLLLQLWILVSCGLHLPPPLSALEKDAISDRLMGKRNTKLTQMIKDYILLSSSELTFENCLLTVLVGTLIVKRNPMLSHVMSMGLKRRGSLLLNLEYIGSKKSLDKLAMMIKKLDGLSLFESEDLLQRFVNLSTQVPICNQINTGENEMTYVDFYLKNRNDIYGVLYSWRIIELIHELNLVYLELLASNTDKNCGSMVGLIKDTQKLEEFVADDSALKRHVLLMKSIICSNDVPSMMKQFQDDIQEYLWKLGAVYQEPEIFDSEEDDSSGETGVDNTNSTLAEKSNNNLARDIVINQSILYSLNIIDEEKLVAIVSSSLCYYMENNQNTKLLRFLRLLQFKKQDQPVSLLTLTCFLKLLSVIVQSEDDDKSEDSEDKKTLWASMDSETTSVLESLVKLCRGFLNDNNMKDPLTHLLRSELSELVIKKGLVLNGI